MAAPPVAIVVDAIDALVTIAAERVQTQAAQLSVEQGERVTGAFPLGDGEGAAKILDVQALLAEVFARRTRPNHRFDMPRLEQSEGRRLIVVRTGRHRAGLIVDSVSEVLRTTADAIKDASDLTKDIARLVHGVVNIEAEGRILLILDPAEFLTRAERGMLDKFESSAQAPS
jgi:chemotaxis signal transduction protein